ncbi:MAG: hypothetical protein RI544_03890 [Haloquadratum sp.]|jgi:hypothetical protein|nr:hypothetical protein [Haloferacaceae archaeon]MDR9445283.1 hypothetical protein [Haloquadratum sp.]
MATIHWERFGPLHFVGFITAFVSGVVHLVLGVQAFPSGFGIAFLFAAVMFFVGIAAVMYDIYPRRMYQLGIPFTAGQIVLWYVGNQPTLSSLLQSPAAIVDKLAQVILIIVLIQLLRTE